jgi:hypothetical protein
VPAPATRAKSMRSAIDRESRRQAKTLRHLGP